MAALARSRRRKTGLGPGESHAVEGYLLAVRHCTSDSRSALLVRVSVIAWRLNGAKGAGEAVEAVLGRSR